MSEENSEEPFFGDWLTIYMYAGSFGKVIDNLEARGCVSKSVALETKKTIAELQKLIEVVAVTHDREKQNRAGDLFHTVMLTLFNALDNCFDKYFGSGVD